MDIFSIVAAISWVILIYAWIAYPLILICLTTFSSHFESFEIACRLRSPGLKRDSEWDTRRSAFPSISVIIAAYNEEKHIGARIENLLGLDFPQEKLTIRVGVDGSTDKTAEIAKQWAPSHSRVQVYDFSERRGKIAVLKDLVTNSEEEILVFTDANTFFKKDAIKLLLNPFEDPLVGGVCGRLLFRGEEKEGAYWRWETRLKHLESSLDSCLGANGAIYAIRRSLFWKKIPSNTIVDDFVIGMKVREQGFRLIYEPLAMAEEDYPSEEQEWGRRVRIGAGDYQALGLCSRCLLPRYGKFAWMFWSHKVLRWFTPHLLMFMVLLAFVSYALGFLLETVNSFVSGCNFNIITVVLLLLAILNAVTTRLLRRFSSTNMARKFLKPLGLFDYFFSMQIALFFGFLRHCRGNLQGYWTRTPRD